MSSPMSTPRSVGTAAHGFNEYPVLTGFSCGDRMASLERILLPGRHDAALALCALARRGCFGGWRPPARCCGGVAVLVLYAFHNWDLLAVSASVVGDLPVVVGHCHGCRDRVRGGGAFKLYPALFIVPLMLRPDRRRREQKGGESAGDRVRVARA